MSIARCSFQICQRVSTPVLERILSREVILITPTRFSCERTKFTRPGDFLMFLVFCGTVIVVNNPLDAVSFHDSTFFAGGD